jgi:hypothetical protein
MGAASLIAASTAAFAGEQTLEFKLVTKALDPKVVNASLTEAWSSSILRTLSITTRYGIRPSPISRVPWIH